jgi:adenosylcobinamide kinase/adenosylcobinamide-phosphate guanylyltransferase
MIILITGGERSGKSRFAQSLALQKNSHPAYIATARKWDADFEKRIQRHQQERSEAWHNYEIERNISSANIKESVAVVDCITLWLANLFSDHQQNIEDSLVEFKRDVDALCSQEKLYIVVTNEIGMGLHATSEMSRKFVELQGWANQHAAAQAREVYFMVSGIPLKIKPGLDHGK